MLRRFDSRRLHSSPELSSASRSMMTSGDFGFDPGGELADAGEAAIGRECFDRLELGREHTGAGEAKAPRH